MKQKVIIDNVDYTKKSTLPIQEQRTADESLDAGYLELFATDKDKPFKPFSKLQIHKDDGTQQNTEYYYIAGDDSAEIIKNKKFNHDIVLIEETKELERYVVDVKTLTNPIVHNYLENPSKVMVNGSTTTYWIFTSTFYVTFDIYSPQEVNKSMTIPRPYYLLKAIQNQANTWDGGSIVNVELSIYDPDNERVWYGYDGWSSLPQEQTFDFTPTKEGEYTFKINGTSTIGITEGEMTFKVNILSKTANKDDYTIQDACEILLATCETLRESETQRFTLASVADYPQSQQAEITKIYAMKSPEFSHTKCTLFEALKEIGDYIHAIPRLRQNKVYFDLLGLDEECSVNLEKYHSHEQSQSIDNFCSELDTNVENLLNTDDEVTGSITEPYNNQFKTLRVEKGSAQITEDGIFIETEYPIYDVKSLEVGYMKNGIYVGDITPYVYEDAEYQTLSSSGDTFPTAMMFALKYTQGEKNITGLNFKNDNIISPAFENYSVLNIIHKKCNLATNWWSNLWDDEDIFNLQFRVVYTPIISTRLKQTKTYLGDLAFRNVLTYNQGANMISSNAYGEHLRGVVAKYGVPERKIMLTVNKLADVPKVNTKYKGYTITSVKTETYNNQILVEVGMSKKFNNKSAFISINNQKRFYEVSEKACAERFILYEDYCVIGDTYVSDGKELITSDGLDAFIASITNGTSKQIGVVKALGYNKTGTEQVEVAKPVFALGVGTSILFGFSYDDNYSAGCYAMTDGAKKVQNYVKYTDIYGELEKLRLKFGRGTNEIDSYNMSVTRGDLTPKGSAVPDGNMIVYFSTGTDKIVIKKDSREKLSVSYQMHFITNRENLIIGSGIGRKNVFTSNDALNYKLFILPKKINEFERDIDLTNATELSISLTKSSHQIKFDNVTATENGYSWALVNVGTTNELICGENINITKGSEISLPYFTFTRKIRD